MSQKEVIIIGGGLAGLTAAIHLAKNDLCITLFEKEKYPRHKVCGEYLSREILPYFDNLGIPLSEVSSKHLNKLLYTTQTGKTLENELDPGGLGISRFTLDNLLYETAKKHGVIIKQEKVLAVTYTKDFHEVKTERGNYPAHYVFGAFGKRSALDKQFDRKFFRKAAPWVAVKSHFRHFSFPEDQVALHSFRGGYCGLSKTETEAVNVCYLATYKSFKKYKDPETFKDRVLRKNPFLNKFFSEAEEIFPRPLSIAQISFSEKSLVEDHVLMIGDAAGLIHPLCGNGMAMAIHSGKIASEVLLKHLQLKTDREEFEREYSKTWKHVFRSRMRTGKWLQKILLNETYASLSQSLISNIPVILTTIIQQTHGKPLK